MQWLLPPILFLIAIAVMLLLHTLSPMTAVIPPPYTWLGAIPVLTGIGISAWHNRLFHRIGTNIYTFDEPGQLVRHGMFKYTRNPMYLGFALALLGMFVMLGSLSPLPVALLFIVITDRWYIAFEEQMMADKFGDEYLAYKQSVRRWI